MRKGLAFLFLVAFLLQISVVVEAANWVKLTESKKDSAKIIWYIDKGSIQTNASGAREVWMKTIFDPPSQTTDASGKKVYRNASLDFLMVTPDKSYCVKEVVSYYTNGKNSTASSKCELSKIPPESLGELIWEFLFK